MLNYETAGVDIDQGNNLVSFIKRINSSIGGYNAIIEMDKSLQNPMLVFSCDGVGTKLKLAKTERDLENIGIDLVAMVANDIICSGATPKVFLDYIAHSTLSLDQLKAIISGIYKGCSLAVMSLVGGETAQLPGLYAEKDYDLAGFGMGMIEKQYVINPSLVKEGDVILGIKSSGIHSNGYSLVNKILEEQQIDLDKPENYILRKKILKPTTIYVEPVLTILESFRSNIHGIAHITGGGFYENVPRILPKHLLAKFNYKIVDNLLENSGSIFAWILEKSSMTFDQMLRTYNCGYGLIIITDEPDVVQEFWNDNYNEDLFCDKIGVIKKLPKNNQVVIEGVDE